MPVRRATAEWKGDGPKGSGSVSTETGAVEGPDQGCAAQIAVSVDQGRIRLVLPRAARAAHG